MKPKSNLSFLVIFRPKKLVASGRHEYSLPVFLFFPFSLLFLPFFFHGKGSPAMGSKEMHELVKNFFDKLAKAGRQ